MSTSLRTSKLIETCPPSISYDAQVQCAAAAFDFQFYSVIDDTGAVAFIPNIMGLTDSKLVDILAWQFHVDYYDETLDLELRKKLVQLSIQWHKTKGTVALIEEVLNTFWPGGAWLEEWYQYKDPFPPNYPTTGWHDRYKFRVIINEDVIDEEAEILALKLIDLYKPISRWREAVIRPKPTSGTLYAAGAVQHFITRKFNQARLR